VAPSEGATSDTAATVPEANQTDVLGNTSTDKPAEKTNQAPAKSWRDWLPIHPAADKFDLLPKLQLQELADDIKANGLREPCSLREVDGRPELLDGRNRLDALTLMGQEITFNNSAIFEKLPGDIDPVDYIISKNIHRRHLTPEEREKRLIELIAMRPGDSDRKLAQKAGVDHKTMAKARRKAEQLGRAPQLKTRVGRDGRARTSTPARAMPAPTPNNPAAKPPTPPVGTCKTSALLKGQEGLDQQLRDVKSSIEWLVGYARSCNKVTEIISALRAHLDAVEDHDAKVARVPANAGAP
jgi:hypothetical protein